MNVVRHRFTSAKLDGPDATQVQPSNWNDGHAFTGGAAGDALTRDPADGAFGATWVPTGTGQLFAGTSATLPTTTRDHVLILTSPGAFHGAAPASGAFAIGTRLTIKNASGGDVTLIHQSSGIAVGRLANIVTASNATQLAAGDGAAVYVWDGSNWNLVSHLQGRANAIGLSAANFVGFTAASIPVQEFTLEGSDLRIRIVLSPASIPVSVAKLSIVGWPWTFAINAPILVGTATHPVSWSPCAIVVGSTAIDLYQMDTSQPWPAGEIYFGFDIRVPIL
jgi:hypothetical protein